MKPRQTIRAQYQGFCNTCQFTIYKGEQIGYNGLAYHLNCIEALSDKYNRQLNPVYKTTVGKIKKSKMKEMIKQRRQVTK